MRGTKMSCPASLATPCHLAVTYKRQDNFGFRFGISAARWPSCESWINLCSNNFLRSSPCFTRICSSRRLPYSNTL